MLGVDGGKKIASASTSSWLYVAAGKDRPATPRTRMIFSECPGAQNAANDDGLNGEFLNRAHAFGNRAASTTRRADPNLSQNPQLRTILFPLAPSTWIHQTKPHRVSSKTRHLIRTFLLNLVKRRRCLFIYLQRREGLEMGAWCARLPDSHSASAHHRPRGTPVHQCARRLARQGDGPARPPVAFRDRRRQGGQCLRGASTTTVATHQTRGLIEHADH